MVARLPRLVCGFYFNLLDIDQQVLYKKIGLGVADYRASVKVGSVDMKILRKVFMAISYDNPEFYYWIPNMCEVIGEELLLKYCVEEEEVFSNLAMIRKECKRIIEMCKGEQPQTPEEFLALIYKFLKENVVYAVHALEQSEQPKHIYGMDGVFLRKEAVCMGIAQAVNYICQYVRIPHILVTGEAKIRGVQMKHAWNLVEVNGKYRHLDVTADICEGNGCTYQYFLLQDWEMTERKWPDGTYPKAE